MKKFLLMFPLLLNGCGCEVVDTGRRGVKTEFGKVMGEALPEGLHFYNPFTTDIVEMDVQEQKVEGNTSCFTRDTQMVQVSYAMTYFPDAALIHKTYEKFGKDWETKVISPAVLGSIKDAIGQYIADDLVAQREKATASVFEELRESLLKRNVTVTRLDLTNLDFDDAYEKAVEDKVVAVQKAAEAKNKTVQVTEEAKQTIEKAKAEAESMKIRAQALQANKSLVEYEAVQKWDGKLPQYSMGGAIPFLNLNKL